MRQKRNKREPSTAAGRLAIAMGASYLAIALFSSLRPSQKLTGAATACLALSWGLKELIAAKRWKQEPEEAHYATTPSEIRESVQAEKLEKSGSMQNALTLLVWIFLFLLVAGASMVGYKFLTRHRP